MKVIRRATVSHKTYASSNKKVTSNSSTSCNQRDLCMVKHG